MDFTREPIIETIITPREGFKLVVRSSKGIGQEEYFVEAVEIVSFGNALFFRSLERPKCFLVPVTEYEVLEVREARMVLKNVGAESTIKIAGGREARPRPIPREPVERVEGEEVAKTTNGEIKSDKKRERRRQGRRRRGGREDRPEGAPREGAPAEQSVEEQGFADHVDLPPPRAVDESRERREGSGILSLILPPPPQLISETIGRYREDDLFKGVFHAPKLDEASADDLRREFGGHSEEQTEDAEPPRSRPRHARQSESEADVMAEEVITRAFFESDENEEPRS